VYLEKTNERETKNIHSRKLKYESDDIYVSENKDPIPHAEESVSTELSNTELIVLEYLDRED
jgi:hypothetical protein